MNAGGRSEPTLAAAMAQHRAGRLNEAERLYRQATVADPEYALAFFDLGNVLDEMQQLDEIRTPSP